MILYGRLSFVVYHCFIVLKYYKKNGRAKKLHINTFFKDFYDDIKTNLEIIDSQAPAKRKSTAQDDDTHTKRQKTWFRTLIIFVWI